MAEFSSSLWHSHLWHPFTQVATAEPPLRVVSARGSLLYLEQGSTLIDAISSWWVTLHGHAEPSIAAAIAAQTMVLEQVIFANFRHVGAERLAERLCRHTGLDRLFFSDNGSTAVEVALKIAWQWWHNCGEPRSQVIAFAGAYHGDILGREAIRDLQPMQPGDVPATAADTSALEAWVGFRPTTPIETGVERFAAWYRGYFGG